MNLKYFKNPRLLAKLIIKKLSRRGIPSVEGFLLRSKVKLNLKRDKKLKSGTKWDGLLDEIIEEINNSPMTFLRSPAIRQTIHPNQQDLARSYFEDLLKKPFFTDHIFPRVQEPSMGDPYLCDFFPFASPLSIQYLYYLTLMHEKFGFFLPESQVNHIVEIGGGYGNLCRLMKSFGFNGRYVIVDMPDMHKIQEHYLNYVLSGKLNETAIEFRMTDGLSRFSAPKDSILIATFSLNEMPMDLRKSIEPFYKNFGYLFFAYNRTFCGVDNYKYFADLSSRLVDTFFVQVFDDPHRRARFMLCARK